MPLKIPQDHAIFSLKPQVTKATQEFCDAFGFSYFQYLRVYHDGAMGLLTNHTGLIEFVCDLKDDIPAIYSSFRSTHQNQHAYWFMWDEELPTYPVTLAREKFRFHHGITWLRRHKDHYDMIAVALPHPLGNATSFYLNKINLLEEFFLNFEWHHKDLFSIMNKTRLPLPRIHQDQNAQNLCLISGRLPLQGAEGPCYLTTQELNCLRLIFRGRTEKEVARALEISPRSVQTYLERVKNRTGLSLFEVERKLLSPPT